MTRNRAGRDRRRAPRSECRRPVASMRSTGPAAAGGAPGRRFMNPATCSDAPPDRPAVAVARAGRMMQD